MSKVIVLHDFDGSLYFKALESVAEVQYFNIQPFRFLVRDIVKHRKMQKSTVNSLLFILSMFFKRNATVIIGTAPFNFRFLIYAFILSGKNKVYLHTSWPYWVESPPVRYPSFLNKLAKKLWIKSLPKLNGVIAVTKATKNSVMNFLESNQCKVPYAVTQIYHVVDISKISDKLFSDKWQKPENVTFLGRLEAEKGISEFLELSKNFSERETLKFQVIGKGSLEKKVVHWAGSSGNNVYHGFISSRGKIKELLAKTNVLVLPSKRIPGWEELFGLVIIEAMSQGVIVLTTDHIGPKEIIENGYDSFFCPEERFITFASTILDQLSEQPVKYSQIAQKAIVKSQAFNMAAIGREWKEFLKVNKLD
ncbi:glycosyltransferase family 4 protein [Catenovulum sediminis]|uniref:glycosyltransferase family 4 protein n=1 Tax=Catenovulum sediminis TaxID=1740262 RepID=UPI00117F4EA8|nr:glycosyltransferase family 4 protein [Catenovulum sediminis]